MLSIQTLIGKRFESILQKKYPELRYIGDEENLVPDFEHHLFYAEAKVSFMQHDFAVHLKQYQVDSFKRFEKNKPVLYLLGFHNFEKATQRLSGLSAKKIEKILSEEMDIVRLYIVDNKAIKGIWQKRNYICEKGHIQDCTLREGHLRQIIGNKSIEVAGKEYNAREYYGIPSKFSFSLPSSKDNSTEMGHIIPSNLGKILDYFYK
jgi:hypothetical protein